MAEAAVDNTLLGDADDDGQQNPPGDAPAAGQETGQADVAGDQSTKKDDGGAEGAPEAYEAFSFPDGVEVDQGLLERFGDTARELNLSQDGAQKLVAMYTEALTGAQGSMQEIHAQRLEQWVSDLRQDPEFGGPKGAKFEANVGIARKAVQQFGSDEFRELMNETGLGNHPEMVKFMHKIGAAISEDSVAFGAMGGGAPKTAAQLLYPDAESP